MALKGHVPWNKGIRGIHNPHTSEWNKKISLALMGKKNNLGKKLSEETKKKISMAHKGMKKPWTTKRNLENNPIMRGKNHPNWKGGTGTERHQLMQQKEYILWRVAVFTRDDYTCQKCGIRGKHMEVHHIKSWVEYPELRYAIDNGQTLCINCHRSSETWGYRVFQRKALG